MLSLRHLALILICFSLQACFGARVECDNTQTPAESLRDFSQKLDADKKAKLEEKVGKLVLKRTMGNLGSMAAMALTGDEEDLGKSLKNDVFKDFCGKSYDDIMAMDN